MSETFNKNSMNGFGLKRTLNRVQSRLPLVLIISVFLAVAVFAMIRNKDPVYEIHFSYLVSLKEREGGEDYRYDGYYALQATDLFTATLAQWIKAPEVVAGVREKAGYPVSNDSKEVVSSVKAVKTAPQLIEVTIVDDDRERAEKILKGLEDVVSTMIEAYNESDAELVFEMMRTNSWVGQKKLSATIISLLVFVFAVFLGINLVLIEQVWRG